MTISQEDSFESDAEMEVCIQGVFQESEPYREVNEKIKEWIFFLVLCMYVCIYNRQTSGILWVLFQATAVRQILQ